MYPTKACAAENAFTAVNACIDGSGDLGSKAGCADESDAALCKGRSACGMSCRSERTMRRRSTCPIIPSSRTWLAISRCASVTSCVAQCRLIDVECAELLD